MPAYQYTALDAEGKTHKGIQESDSPKQARQWLRDQGLTPLTVEASGARQHYRKHRLNATDLALITRQLATLIGAGVPVEETLAAVSRQNDNAAQLLMAIRATVLEGHTLARALQDYPGAFPELYRTTVAAGEQAGHLEIVFEQLADYTENRQAMRRKITLALFYPMMLVIVAILIVAGLLVYVVPQVVQVFQSMNQQLPGLTVALIATSDFLRNHGIVLLVVLAVVFCGFILALKKPPIRQQWHRLLLRVPITGKLFRGINTARFVQTFNILMASGVPVLESLKVSAPVITCLPMRHAVEQAGIRVKEGMSIHRALADSGNHFPPMTLQMIASGETSGRLQTMLEKAARQQERETETMISAILAIFEPALILIMGFLVLLIVLAILLPIFDLNRMIG